MTQPEALARPEWRGTGHARFPLAADVAGHWWVLRLNPFPDHCLWTLFVDAVVRYDIEEVPAAWGKPSPRSAPPLDPAVAQTVLAPVRHLAVYGSEVGRPCDCLFCGD
ncbi:hypothetical protein ABZ413_34140 [Nocardia rhamnosiphila]|uniref:hypothetical protein n=1 Tax=Nocardia rhamnosiphila TaxID=426716 RepID=UPI0033C014B1